MLFDAFIRGLEVVSDVIEFGPVKAAQINTSVIPEAERATTRILGDLEKENYTSTRPHTEPSVYGTPSKRKPVSGTKSLSEIVRDAIAEQNEEEDSEPIIEIKKERKSGDESVLDQAEEDMISKAVAEKGYY